MVRKEFLQLRRDRRMLPILFISPLFQLLVLGYAANLDVRNIALCVYDGDRSAQSRALAAQFTNSGYFTLTRYAESRQDAERSLADGAASVALVFPPGFGDDIKRGVSAHLQLMADGSESNSAVIGMNYASLIVARYGQRAALVRAGPPAGAEPQVRVIPRVWYNPELRSRNFMIPGVLALILMVMTIILTSLSIVKEKERGTMEQLVVTPLRPVELIVGKLTPFVAISFVLVTIVVAASLLIFGIRVKGSLFLLYLLSAEFLLTTLGLGMFVSTIARTQQQAMMFSIFFILFPMIILSGFVFPIENMPPAIQVITYLLPLRYYFVIIRGLFLKGTGLAVLWKEALALLGFGLVIISVSILRFRKRLE
jgi:ABC-2 type transport system permease protein